MRLNGNENNAYHCRAMKQFTAQLTHRQNQRKRCTLSRDGGNSILGLASCCPIRASPVEAMSSLALVLQLCSLLREYDTSSFSPTIEIPSRPLPCLFQHGEILLVCWRPTALLEEALLYKTMDHPLGGHHYLLFGFHSVQYLLSFQPSSLDSISECPATPSIIILDEWMRCILELAGFIDTDVALYL
jgi:hypothetical protein